MINRIVVLKITINRESISFPNPYFFPPRLPGEGQDSFWKVLVEGRNCVSDIPEERFNTAYWYDADDNKPGKTQTTKAALITG